MDVRANTWHLRMYLQAYVNDRNWLDAETYDELKAEGAPDGSVYEEERKLFNQTPNSQMTQELQAIFYERQAGHNSAFQKWRKQQWAIYTAEKSRETSDRLYSGKMILFPYFGNLLVALVFYYCVVRSTRPVRRFFNNTVDSLATAAGTIITLSLFLPMFTLWCWPGKRIWSAEKQLSRFQLWLARQIQKLFAKAEPLRRLWQDSKESVAAFIKKKKVCPYLRVTSEQNRVRT